MGPHPNPLPAEPGEGVRARGFSMPSPQQVEGRSTGSALCPSRQLCIICTMTQTSKRPGARASCCPDLEAFIDPGLFKALGDPNRVALIAGIGRLGRPTTVSEAASCCPVDLSVVSRHLAVLRRAGVVESAKTGREVRYTLSPAALAATLRSLADALEACCPEQPADAQSGGAGDKDGAHPPSLPTEV
jgi:DNA-binding transcriptional ArsR family regulator